MIELSELEEAVAAYISTAAPKMRKEKQRATGANVYFEYYSEYEPNKREGGVSGTSVSFDRPTGDTGEMLSKIYPALPKLFSEGRRYKKAGVVFFGLEGARGDQLDLFMPLYPNTVTNSTPLSTILISDSGERPYSI